jgi:hypothetical protein
MSSKGWGHTRGGGRLPKPVHIRVGEIKRGGPGAVLSIQCFEQRHSDCGGRDTLFGHVCGCDCHATKEKPVG